MPSYVAGAVLAAVAVATTNGAGGAGTSVSGEAAFAGPLGLAEVWLGLAVEVARAVVDTSVARGDGTSVAFSGTAVVETGVVVKLRCSIGAVGVMVAICSKPDCDAEIAPDERPAPQAAQPRQRRRAIKATPRSIKLDSLAIIRVL
jgi:hypothetical protein